MHLIITFYKYCTYILCCSFFIYAHKYPRGFRLGHFDYWYLLLVCCYNRLRHIPMWEKKNHFLDDYIITWKKISTGLSLLHPHPLKTLTNPKRDIPILSFPLTQVILPLCPLQEFLPQLNLQHNYITFEIIRRKLFKRNLEKF